MNKVTKPPTWLTTAVLRKWIRMYWDGAKTPVIYIFSLDSKLLSYTAGWTGSCTPNGLWRHCRKWKQRAHQINLLNLMNRLANWKRYVPKLRVCKRRTRLDQIIHTEKTETAVNWRRSNVRSDGHQSSAAFRYRGRGFDCTNCDSPMSYNMNQQDALFYINLPGC